MKKSVSVVIPYKETEKLMGGFFVDAQNNRRKEVKSQKGEIQHGVAQKTNEEHKKSSEKIFCII